MTHSRWRSGSNPSKVYCHGEDLKIGLLGENRTWTRVNTTSHFLREMIYIYDDVLNNKQFFY